MVMKDQEVLQMLEKAWRVSASTYSSFVRARMQVQNRATKPNEGLATTQRKAGMQRSCTL